MSTLRVSCGLWPVDGRPEVHWCNFLEGLERMFLENSLVAVQGIKALKTRIAQVACVPTVHSHLCTHSHCCFHYVNIRLCRLHCSSRKDKGFHSQLTFINSRLQEYNKAEKVKFNQDLNNIGNHAQQLKKEKHKKNQQTVMDSWWGHANTTWLAFNRPLACHWKRKWNFLLNWSDQSSVNEWEGNVTAIFMLLLWYFVQSKYLIFIHSKATLVCNRDNRVRTASGRGEFYYWNLLIWMTYSCSCNYSEKKFVTSLCYVKGVSLRWNRVWIGGALQ